MGPAPSLLNSYKLEQWWLLSFKEFRKELVKSFERDIRPSERDDWEELLHMRTLEIEGLTKQIESLEKELNKFVYEVFGLNENEVELIEQETKYHYGEW